MDNALHFTKMNGTGNDFIIVDNRGQKIDKTEMSALAKRLCHRQYSVGADGLILIENSDRADFRWQFYNADGSEAEMCGNGARCAARFAYIKGIATARQKFETLAGLIEAEMVGNNVKIRLTPPTDFNFSRTVEVEGRPLKVHSVNTGVPHAVHFVSDIGEAKVRELGRVIRFHQLFAPAGANVNFVQSINGILHVRTYERGVEDETLACGTGAVASALIAAHQGQVASPVQVRTSGGSELTIHFDLAMGGELGSEAVHVSEVFLEGPATMVYEGELYPEALG